VSAGQEAGTAQDGENTCPECAGTGRVDGAECRDCGGTGTVVEPVGDA
jgi:DnaJ-class molecular chaperone